MIYKAPKSQKESGRI